MPPASTLDEGPRQVFRTMNSHLLVVSGVSTRRKARKPRRIRRGEVATRRPSRDRNTTTIRGNWDTKTTRLSYARFVLEPEAGLAIASGRDIVP
jgi:hypothetical protein